MAEQRRRAAHSHGGAQQQGTLPVHEAAGVGRHNHHGLETDYDAHAGLPRFAMSEDSVAFSSSSSSPSSSSAAAATALSGGVGGSGTGSGGARSSAPTHASSVPIESYTLRPKLRIPNTALSRHQQLERRRAEELAASALGRANAALDDRGRIANSSGNTAGGSPRTGTGTGLLGDDGGGGGGGGGGGSGGTSASLDFDDKTRKKARRDANTGLCGLFNALRRFLFRPVVLCTIALALAFYAFVLWMNGNAAAPVRRHLARDGGIAGPTHDMTQPVQWASKRANWTPEDMHRDLAQRPVDAVAAQLQQQTAAVAAAVAAGAAAAAAGPVEPTSKLASQRPTAAASESGPAALFDTGSELPHVAGQVSPGAVVDLPPEVPPAASSSSSSSSSLASPSSSAGVPTAASASKGAKAVAGKYSVAALLEQAQMGIAKGASLDVVPGASLPAAAAAAVAGAAKSNRGKKGPTKKGGKQKAVALPMPRPGGTGSGAGANLAEVNVTDWDPVYIEPAVRRGTTLRSSAHPLCQDVLSTLDEPGSGNWTVRACRETKSLPPASRPVCDPSGLKDTASWQPFHCSIKFFTQEQACDVMRSYGAAIFVGDGALRHFFQALMAVLRGDLATGSLASGLAADTTKKCQFEDQLDAGCRRHLEDRTRVCDGDVLLYYNSSVNHWSELEAVRRQNASIPELYRWARDFHGAKAKHPVTVLGWGAGFEFERLHMLKMLLRAVVPAHAEQWMPNITKYAPSFQRGRRRRRAAIDWGVLERTKPAMVPAPSDVRPQFAGPVVWENIHEQLVEGKRIMLMRKKYLTTNPRLLQEVHYDLIRSTNAFLRHYTDQLGVRTLNTFNMVPKMFASAVTPTHARDMPKTPILRDGHYFKYFAQVVKVHLLLNYLDQERNKLQDGRLYSELGALVAAMPPPVVTGRRRGRR